MEREGGRQLDEDNQRRFANAAARAVSNEDKRAINWVMFNNASSLWTVIMHGTSVCKQWLSWLKAAIAANDRRMATEVIETLCYLVPIGERSSWMKVCKIQLLAISLLLQMR